MSRQIVKFHQILANEEVTQTGLILGADMAEARLTNIKMTQGRLITFGWVGDDETGFGVLEVSAQAISQEIMERYTTEFKELAVNRVKDTSPPVRVILDNVQAAN